MTAPLRSNRRWWIPVLVAAVLLATVVTVAVALLVNWDRSGPAQVAVDESDSPSGTRGLTLLLGEHGAEVARHSPPLGSESNVALLYEGVVLTPDDEAEMRTWVDRGGVLVVMGAQQRWTTPSAAVTSGEVTDHDCGLSVLADVSTLDTGAGTTEAVTASGQNETACFIEEGGPGGLVSTAGMGEGAVVAVASQELFTNRFLASADNAVLATSLMAPQPGTAVAVVETAAGMPPAPGLGGPGIGDDGQHGGPEPTQADNETAEEQTLADLIPTNLRWGLLQLLVALGALGAWKARRFGQPVSEPVPVPLEGARLVEAVGELLRRAGSAERASELLRNDVHVELTAALGLPREASAELVASRSGTACGSEQVAELVLDALSGYRVHDGKQLTRLARQIEQVRQEVLGGVHPRT